MNAETIIEKRKIANVFFPKCFPITVKATELVAGPASKKTNAAAGFKPLAIKAAAIGIEPEEQIYIGIPRISITTIDLKG